jgi:YHS domain-containing protein
MATRQHQHQQHDSAEVLDPVCGMTISPADAVGTLDHGAHTYHFCSDTCMQKFRENPAQFVGRKSQVSTPPVDADAEYTCPMHPEIRQKGPGSCPICGMALEPVNVSLSGWFVPIVILVAIVTFGVWALYGPAPRFAHAIVNAVAVLIIACPCALGLATPMSIMVGTGRGAELGILLRNAEALELFEKVNTIVVDKTGTLTEGKPRLSVVEPTAGFTEEVILKLTASL